MHSSPQETQRSPFIPAVHTLFRLSFICTEISGKKPVSGFLPLFSNHMPVLFQWLHGAHSVIFQASELVSLTTNTVLFPPWPPASPTSHPQTGLTCCSFPLSSWRLFMPCNMYVRGTAHSQFWTCCMNLGLLLYGSLRCTTATFSLALCTPYSRNLSLCSALRDEESLHVLLSRATVNISAHIEACLQDTSPETHILIKVTSKFWQCYTFLSCSLKSWRPRLCSGSAWLPTCL